MQFWQIASGLGVGAFLAAIFYGIVKTFGRNKGQGFETSQLSPLATSIIAILIVILGATITIVGLVLYRPDKPSAQVLRSLRQKYEAGEKRFEELKSRDDIPADQKKKISDVHSGYKEFMKGSIKALEDGDGDGYQENKKELDFLITSDKAKAIPDSDLEYLKRKACTLPDFDGEHLKSPNLLKPKTG